MQITWYGHSCFLIQNEQTKIIIDPFNERSIGLKRPDATADIVLMSHDHYDHNASNSIDGAHEDHMAHNGGFNSHGIDFLGLDTYHDHELGAKRGHNTMYLFRLDGISICHCGDLGCIPSEEVLKEIAGVDILMIPIGGYYTLELDEVMKLIDIINPSVVIPMHYRIGGLKIDEISDLDPFIRSVSKRTIVNIGKTIDINKDEMPIDKEIWVFDN